MNFSLGAILNSRRRKGRRHFLPQKCAASDDSTERRRNHGVTANAAHFIREHSTHALCNLRVLKQESALKELAAMQFGTQDEMLVQQRPRFAEKREQLVAQLR
jgi:hypothetical protein